MTCLMVVASSLVMGTLQAILTQDDVEALDSIVHYTLHVP